MRTVLISVFSVLSVHAQVNRTVSIRGDEIMITFQRTQGFMKVVTGAPYSGDLIAEHSQTLTDGDVIQDPPGSQHNIRDGQGRFRVEVPLVVPGSDPKAWQPSLTQISDPAAGFLYIFDDQHKIAHRTKLNQGPHPNPPRKFFVGESNVAPASEGRPERKTENLGEKLTEGLTVKGVRYTTTWPPGTRNNNKSPFVTTQETWFSEELQEVIYQKFTNPRNGEVVQRLANIDRSEPSPALFQPPPDYQVVDEEDAFTITLRRPRP